MPMNKMVLTYLPKYNNWTKTMFMWFITVIVPSLAGVHYALRLINKILADFDEAVVRFHKLKASLKKLIKK